MANQDRPRGFEPYGRVKQCNEYDASAICYPGDLLKLKSDGTVEPAAAGAAQAMGVALNYCASGGKVLVADDPTQLFIAQVNGASVDAATDLNLNYDISVGTASTLFQRSMMEIAHASGATDSNLPLKVLRITKEINNALGADVDVVCLINNHAYKGGGVGSLGV
jgi:hypothetical protein